jgi:hypothetical protein
MEIVADENITSTDVTNHLGFYYSGTGYGWGNNTQVSPPASGTPVITLGSSAYLTGATGLAYKNREGTFAVPTRQLYLEIDLNSATGWMTSGGQAVVGAAPATIEVEMACDVGGEIN